MPEPRLPDPRPRRTVGIDLVSVAEVRTAIAAHGARYLERICSEAERGAWGSGPRGVAACFAVKEATIKALRLPAHAALPLRAISVGRDRRGSPRVTLSGTATELAAAGGLMSVVATVDTDRRCASALVLAVFAPRPPIP